MLYRNNSENQSDSSTSQLIELIIAKQRNGPTGIVKLKFNQEQTKFYNQD